MIYIMSLPLLLSQVQLLGGEPGRRGVFVSPSSQVRLYCPPCVTMEGPAVENLIDFDIPSSTEVTAPSSVDPPDLLSAEPLVPESVCELPKPMAPRPAAYGREEDTEDSDATESADSENDATDSLSHTSISRRSSSSSNHSAEDADVAERRGFMKAYVEKLFHGR